MNFFNLHSHSEFSCLDGMPTVQAMVDRASIDLKQPALGLSDHGNMAGAVQLYTACRQAKITPFIGEEFYLVSDINDKAAPRYHIGLYALTFRGFRGLVRLSTKSHHRDWFYRKPRIGMKDLQQFAEEYGDDIAVLSGCYFGLPVQTLLNKGAIGCEVILRTWRTWFPNFFIEIQNHQTVENAMSDFEVSVQLEEIAVKLNLPILVTQDAHYLSAKHKPMHEMMKRVGYFGGDVDDYLFPGDSYHLASGDWVRKHYEVDGTLSIWEASENGYAHLLSLHDLQLPALENYKFRVPEFSHHADARLRKMAESGLWMKDRHDWDVYPERLHYELDVIEKMGFANYFLIVSDYCNEARRRGIGINARGSANGSLVCWCIGITEVDSILWKVPFDRFLSVDRMKPPDIDLDVASNRRGEMIEYIAGQFRTVAIGTYGRMQEADGRGSVFVKYLAAKRRELGDKFKGSEFDVKSLYDLDNIVPDDTKVLRELAGTPGIRVRTQPGVHAAGLVLGTKYQPISFYIPLQLIASSNTMCTQYMMDDVESLGYVKADILGLKELETRDRALELIGRNPADGMEWIPLDDKDACKLLSSGRPDTGIFQFSGYSTARGGKEMKITCTNDAIFCLALYRPAMIKTGAKDQFLYNRRNPRSIKYIHDVFRAILGETYGVIVFQEQVIELLQNIGMENKDVNDMLKAIKASNDKISEYAVVIFQRIQPLFTRLCRDIGMTQLQAKAAWKTIMGFSEYGFNRAHATAYGLQAYRMAWIKAHYPTEFMTAVLQTWAGKKERERIYLKEARETGINILRCDVNESNENWTLTPRGIRRGLLSVPHLGDAAAAEIVHVRNEGGKFESVDDIIARCNGGPGMVTGGKSWAKSGTLNGVLGELQKAGALASITK